MQSRTIAWVFIVVVGAACNQTISGSSLTEAEEFSDSGCDDDSRLVCDGLCIDPSSHAAYCGAQADCLGENAGTVCSNGMACQAGVCVGTEIVPPDDPVPQAQAECVNCSFESGDFTGWEAQDLADPFLALAVDRAGVVSDPPFFPSEPTEGVFSIVHGFDGDGPGLISVSQTIELPEAERTTMTLDYRAAWDLLTYGATQPRTFIVQVETPEGMPLNASFILTAEAGTMQADTTPQTATVELSQFAGQTVRLSFLWDVPENYSGPAFFQLDNVSIVSE